MIQIVKTYIFSMTQSGTKKRLTEICKPIFLAERQGFEPWIQSPVCRISSAVHSTTLASLLSKSDAKI